jgi:uncharacterized protein YndB with AHSA1/START domain
MLHKLRIRIDKPPVEVFQFLCNKDTYKQQNGSPVLLLEKTTTGPLEVGTRYREVVQMAPFIKTQMLSEITRYEPYSVLEEKWAGGGMKGILTYFFHQLGDGTELVQHVSVETRWLLRPFNTIISKTYSKAAQYRLEVIKTILETGQSPDIQKIKWWHFSKKGKR